MELSVWRESIVTWASTSCRKSRARKPLSCSFVTDTCSGNSINSDADIVESASSLFQTISDASELKGMDHSCTAPVLVVMTS